MGESSDFDPNNLNYLSLTFWNRRRSGFINRLRDSTIDIKLLDKLDGYDYSASPFFEKGDPGNKYRHILTANERFATTLSLILNTWIILVFIRVLGMKRLPSMMLVSKAASNLVMTGAQILHTSVAEFDILGHNRYICRVNAQINGQAWNLCWNVMSCAIIERLLAQAVPTYYDHAKHIFGPALLAAPWIYWTFYAGLIVSTKFYNRDFGYDCTSHSNRIGTAVLGAQGSAILKISIAAVVVLFISMVLMWKKDSGDLVEIHLACFEQKTTYLILKLMGLHILFVAPMWFLAVPGVTGYAYETMHNQAVQIKIYDGLLLFFLLLTRQEFRNSLRRVFHSSSKLYRSRATNLLVKQRTRADITETLLRQSLRSSYDSQLSVGSAQSADLPKKQEEPKPKLLPAQRELAMVGRDQVESTDVPEWLQMKEKS